MDTKPVENSVHKKKDDVEKKAENSDLKVDQTQEKNTSASDESGGNEILCNYFRLC